MAIRDGDRPRFQDRMTERSSLVPIAIAAIVALLLGWWLMTGPTTNDTGMTGTSAPTTTQPNTNKGGTSKQP